MANIYGIMKSIFINSMKGKFTYLSLLLLITINTLSQEFKGTDLLKKAISYHDPNSKWDSFDGNFIVTSESPKRSIRKSIISLNNSESFFGIEVQQDENIITSILDKNDCSILFNGKFDFSNEIKDKYRLDCERVKYLRNYYTYLYGLPMKLNDPGTIIEPNVEKRLINGEEYWVLKATYEESVGRDTWYFFFDKQTFALKRYQFFHDESKNDGEYILLNDEILVEGIKMPKNRSWYFNSNDKFLATDRLSVE